MSLRDISVFVLDISSESIKPAILVSLLSVAVLIGLFTYLNHYTKRGYFTIWTVAWLFYGVWLILSYRLLSIGETPFLIMLSHWCVGISAVFLLWGSLQFLVLQVRQTLLALFMTFLLVWSYVAAYHFGSSLAMKLPVFGLIGIASLLTANSFFRYSGKKSQMGPTLLGAGFFLLGIYFGGYPFLQTTREGMAGGFFVSAALQLFIAVSMIILVLEEARSANQLAFERIRTQKTETEFLQSKVASTEERYRSLFDQASEAIIITNEDLRILELNQTAQHLLGLNPHEASEQLLSTFCQTNDSSLKTGEDWFKWICKQRLLNLVRKDGSATPAEVDGAPIDFEGKKAYQFFFREMTERARLEQQLRQSEKLSALGQMISGVAHELNNPLAVIKGYLELILAHHELHPQTKGDLQKVSHECNRAAKLVRNFLSFAHEQPANREMVNFNDLIRRIAELRKIDLLVAGAELSLELAPDLQPTYADSDQIQQIIINLLNNSLQAMMDTPPPRRLKIRTQMQKDILQISVEDNGPGVPPDLESKIFEPFFTTKEVGTGTGLGLSIAHSILMEHHGKIFYQRSSLGGAGFFLEIPVVTVGDKSRAETDTVQMAAPSPVPEISPAQILVLDDEKSIAELLCEMLSMLGHHPTLCLNPPQALELIETRNFDLILSDFRMPFMNGQEFYQRVAEKNQALANRIIFLTGDVVNEETQGFLKSTGNPHLAKPFQLANLQVVIAETLAKGQLTPVA